MSERHEPAGLSGRLRATGTGKSMRNVLLATCSVAVTVTLVTTPGPSAQSISAPAGSVAAPDPAIPLYFEAASVKPSDPKNPNQGFSIRRAAGGRFDALNAPLRGLILFAYQIQNFQLVGAPEWIGNARFDIIARMEGDPPAVIPGTGADHMMLAMRTLLTDRFKLFIHRETRELDIYALVMARQDGRPGPNLKPSSGDCSPAAFAARRGAPPPPPGTPPVVCGIQGAPGRIRFGGYPLTLFTNNLSNQVGRAVVDRTGLAGSWDFQLAYAAEPPRGAAPPGIDLPPIDPNAPDLFTALQEQLGLKLESTKGPVEVVVLDSVQQLIPD